MAYQNTFYIYDVPVTCTGSGNHNWITADFRIDASANSANSAYNVSVYTRIDSSGRMNWSGDGIIRVTCNGTTSYKKVTLAMYSSGTTDWDGPATFTFGAPGIVNLAMNFDLDLTSTTGTNGKPGPTHVSDEGNLQHFYYNGYNISIGEGGLPPLVQPPIVTLEHVSSDLDSLTFKWTSNKPLASSKYKVGTGSWINASGTGTSGNFKVNQLSPETNYTIYFSGVSTSEYGSLNSNEVSSSGTTLDMTRITNIGECIFGNSISVSVRKESDKASKLKVWVTGNSRQPEFEFNVNDGTNTITFTQDQLDQIYRCFTTSNSVPIYFSLITTGEWSSWTDTQHNKSLQLTGIAKTAHVGIDEQPRRAQVWMGIDGTPRRAIVWIGDGNNIPRRCI